MKPPLFVRSLTEEERQSLQAGRRSRAVFTVRRSQILLLSAAGQPPSEIAGTVGVCVQTVRNAIRAFNACGIACLQEQSHRTQTRRLIFTPDRLERLRDLLHQSPRQYGQTTSCWTLLLVAKVALAEGITESLVSDETIRDALRRLKVTWRRAKHWLSSPDPDYARKKRHGIA